MRDERPPRPSRILGRRDPRLTARPGRREPRLRLQPRARRGHAAGGREPAARQPARPAAARPARAARRLAALVSDHVTTIVTAVEEPLDLSDFDLAQHLLRTRIYPAEADNGVLAARPFAPGLIEVVVVDTPTTVRTVTTEEMNGWPVSGDALFMLGRANVRADGPLQLDEQDLGGVRVSVLHGWTFYAVTHLAWLEEYLPIGPYGALVIAPNRSLIVAHPLQISAGHPRARYREAVAAATELQAQAHRAYEEGPGSLSPHLYWWRAGELTYLATRYEGDTMVLPEEFASVLATLAAER
ncbi:hypothetical protein [Actinomadura madurae]|uniref:hypothetical protein n=1 Tax=Actinomadura madurae TaxID=1993 RepID=UPI0020D25EE1|nr:hypothetical protein [Actinomadura madurae]MCP9947894.1 hypothetical protein [Actinomadura madurae]MCP9964667.1 hypothetical protein [Actinomadura madurae]MCQ0013338.1 hypothetical protein [Actinomadura madurae]